jgi:hypothetical protein
MERQVEINLEKRAQALKTVMEVVAREARGSVCQPRQSFTQTPKNYARPTTAQYLKQKTLSTPKSNFYNIYPDEE